MADEGVVKRQHFGHGRGDDDALLGQHGHAAGEGKKRVQIVRDHDDGQAQLLVQRLQQRAKGIGTVGVQPGRGFVQHEQGRIHDERARQRHALDHAARQLGGHLVRVARLQAHHLQLEQGGAAHQFIRQGAQLAQREGNVVQHAEGGKQRALLKEHAHARRRARPAQLGGGPPQHAHAASRWRVQPQHLAQQHGFAGAGAAHEREHFAPAHGEIEVFVNDHAPALGQREGAGQAPDFNDGFARRGQQGSVAAPAHMPTLLNSTANSASMRMTAVMAATTEAVVPRPRLSVLGLTCRP